MDVFNKIINEAVITTLSKARKNVDKNPTDGQKEAGNYRKGHVNVLGFQITIENPKGSYRKGKDKDGHEWKTLMHNDYGYFVRTLGKDGDAIDVFIGPNLKSQKIFPIDQFVNGEFDETKVMLGFDNKEEAKAAYLSNYEKDWKGFKYITEVDIDTFKKWLYDGYRQRKPFAKYVRLTENYNTAIKNETSNPNDEIWYRGYESQFGFNGINKNVLWLTDDIDYARCYGDRVVEVVIDGNKLNPASLDEMDEFSSDDYDYYDGPDDDTIVAAMKEGFNCYCFYANDDCSYCICLWDNSVIKSIRELSEEEINSIEGYEGYDITPYRTSLAESKKQRKNDEGKVVPEKCECGGDVVLQIHGEPVYICKKCGKYFGTMPFTNENIDIKKALKNLKKRRDPANIENWDNKMINESFNSPLLAKYAKEHGGLKVYRNGGLRDGVAAYHGGINIDPAQVTDDMLYGEPFKYEWANASNPLQSKNAIHFADGYAVMVKPYDHTRRDNIYVPEPRKKTSRYGSGIGDTGDHNKSRGGFVGNGKDAISAPYNGFSVSDRAGEGQMRREAWNNNLKDIKYWEEKIKELENEIENEPDFYRRNILQKEVYRIKREIANAQENIGKIKKYSRNLRGVAESKEHKPPKDVAAAIRKANRDADIESHGKATDFRTTMTKNPKAYSRKEKHKKQISENVLRQIIRESIEEFYKGSQKEKAAYENACDCLYYGYGFKFWFERNSELLDGNVEFAKKIWCQAKEDLANDF